MSSSGSTHKAYLSVPCPEQNKVLCISLRVPSWNHVMWLVHKHSFSTSAAYMRQWIRSALVQIMFCRLLGAKPSSEPMLGYWDIVNWTLRNKLQWNFNQNTKLFIHENASEKIVCEMAAILSRGRWVNFWFDNMMVSIVTIKLATCYHTINRTNPSKTFVVQFACGSLAHQLSSDKWKPKSLWP